MMDARPIPRGFQTVRRRRCGYRRLAHANPTQDEVASLFDQPVESAVIRMKPCCGKKAMPSSRDVMGEPEAVGAFDGSLARSPPSRGVQRGDEQRDDARRHGGEELAGVIAVLPGSYAASAAFEIELVRSAPRRDEARTMKRTMPTRVAVDAAGRELFERRVARSPG